jgi:hypothetical protein
VLQRLGLIDRPGVAVQDETVSRVGLADAVLDQLVRQLRRHEVAGIEVPLGLQTQLGALFDVLPEQLTGGDLRDPELLGELRRLRPLTGARRPEQNNSHFRNPS